MYQIPIPSLRGSSLALCFVVKIMLLHCNIKNWSNIVKHLEVYKQKGVLVFITLLTKYSFKKSTENQNQTTLVQTLVGLQNFINLGKNLF